MSNQKILGVIGGMGPLATVNFFEKLVEQTTVENDQDHPRIFIDNNPKVPDRTKAILGEGSSPAPVIIEMARNLHRAGADFLAMPCVTAHYWFDEIQKQVDIPIIHMIRETAEVYSSQFSGKKAGLLATAGTLKTRIFQSVFPSDSILTPETESQTQHVMKAIYGVKGGDVTAAKPLILRAADILIHNGAELLIAGCTEVPIILKPGDKAVPLLDPIQVLIECCLRQIFN